ncbi:MAG: class I SAM-dependent methyltransferase [Spirochaetaceae bacterium]|nr:MAG: class I SAM-dependent methyltransferase [Spirochaetaceae bacterium]
MQNPVSHYYDRNTSRFLRFAAAGAGATIHRAVWSEGVTSRTQAVHSVHDLLLRHAPATIAGGAPVAWDLGCGVGASIEYLAARRPGRYRGLTISNLQQRLASERLGKAGGDAAVLKGDFCDRVAIAQLQTDGAPDLVYLIEAFVHATKPTELLAAVAGALKPGGRLCICDDMSVRPEFREHPLLRRFMRGWQLATLWSSGEIRACAGDHGLSCVLDLDLTQWTETGRLRDRFIRVVVALADWSRFSRSRIAQRPFWGNMLGGDALQRATRRGMIEYRFLVLEKR